MAPWLWLTACGFEARVSTGPDVGGMDGGGVMESGCAWAEHFDACELPVAPTQDLVLSGPTKWTFNTSDTGSFGPPVPVGSFATRKLSQTGGGRDVLVLYTNAFTLAADATLAVVGDKALVIAANSTIEIDGLLDAGSHTSTAGVVVLGPGANDIGCPGPLAGGVSNSGQSAEGGGGGGGALAAGGGPGGGSNNGGSAGSPGLPIGIPPFIRAGCAGGAGGGVSSGDGGKGGDASKGGDGGKGGEGGGAIELAARGSITVAGHIGAGGSSGQGGKQSSGGGGGGGGGGIISFHAQTVTFAPGSVIAANGGAGGSGALVDADGSRGGDALVSAASAEGGLIDSGGNPGGAGGASAAGSGARGGGGGSGGGGGGGGSVGFVMVRADAFTFTGSVVSPPVSRL